MSRFFRGALVYTASFVLFILTSLFFFNNCTSSQSTGSSISNNQPLSDSTDISFSKLIISAAGTYGIFDPSVAYDETAKRFWMSYSTVSSSVSWSSQNPHVVKTRLAYSDDKGSSWIDIGELNSIKDITLPLPPPNQAGTWVNEVSQIVFDPSAPTNEKWKLFWMHYLIINNTRHFEHGWMGLKMASTAAGLLTASEIKLFSSQGYDSGNNSATGPTTPPVGGAPAIALETSISSSLNGCLAGEPAAFATSTALYFAFQCEHMTDGNRWISLLKCNSPCNITSPAAWTYLGNFLQKSDASAFGFDAGFAAPGFTESQDGTLHLVVSPVQNIGSPWNNYYKGCYFFEILDLNTANLKKDSSLKPILKKIIHGTSGSFNGACAYHKELTGSGVIYSEINTSLTDLFQIFLSHEKL